MLINDSCCLLKVTDSGIKYDNGVCIKVLSHFQTSTIASDIYHGCRYYISIWVLEGYLLHK